MIDVSNDGHVSDILLFVHDLTDLVNREVNHFGDLGCGPLGLIKLQTLVNIINNSYNSLK